MPRIDADAVVEVHHVVADGERPGDGRRRRLAIAAGPAQPPGAAEDLVVGEHPQRRHDEAAVERADDQRRAGGPEAVVVEQFVEPLALALVVAEDERRRVVAEQRPEPSQVAIDPLGREEADLDVGRLVAEEQAREAGALRAPLVGGEEDVLARRRRLAETPGDVEMMLRLAPGAVDFLVVGVRHLLHHQRVGGKEIEQRAARPPPPLDAAAAAPGRA